MGKTTAQKKWRPCSQTWRKDYANAVGDTTKAYFLVINTFIKLLNVKQLFVVLGPSERTVVVASRVVCLKWRRCIDQLRGTWWSTKLCETGICSATQKQRHIQTS